MPNNNFKRFDNGIQIRPGYASDPVDGKKGEIYYNTTTNRLKYCINDSPVTWTEFGPAAGTVDTSTLRWDNTAQSWVENTNVRSLAGSLTNTVSSGLAKHRFEHSGGSIASALVVDLSASYLDFGGGVFYFTTNSYANVGNGLGTNRLSIDNNTGNIAIYGSSKLLSNTDGSADIGSSGANRIGNLFAKTSLNVGDSLLPGGSINILGTSGTNITYSADGTGDIGSPTNRVDNLYAKSSIHIGGNDASAGLELSSSTKGFLPPRMDIAQRDAIASPATALLIYNTDDQEYNYFDGIEWVPIGSGDGSAAAVGDFRSLEWSAIDDHVLIADHMSLDVTDNLTIACWFKDSTPVTGGSIVFKGVTATNQLSYGIGEDATGKVFAHYYPDGSPANRRKRVSSINIDDNRWHFIVATYAAGVVKLYIDGVEDTSATDDDLGTPGTSIFASTAPLKIGGDGVNGFAALNSKTSQVALWGTSVLSSAEIVELYNQGATLRPDMDCDSYTSSADLISWWSFELIETGLYGVKDGFGHNHGTLTNMDLTDWSPDSPKGANGIKFDQSNILFDTDGAGDIGYNTVGFPNYAAINRPRDAMFKGCLVVGDSPVNFASEGSPGNYGWATIGNASQVTVELGASSGDTDAFIGFISHDGANEHNFGFVSEDPSFDLVYNVDGVKKIRFKANADILWQTDGVGNIGALGANRPNNVYVKTLLKVGDSVSIDTNDITLSAASSADILWATDGAGDIGGGYLANRPAKAYFKDLLNVGKFYNNSDVDRGGIQLYAQGVNPQVVFTAAGSVNYVSLHGGTAHQLYIEIDNEGNVFRWQNKEARFLGSSAANLKWQTDGAGDIGALDANRPAVYYGKTRVEVGDSSSSRPFMRQSGVDGDIGWFTSGGTYFIEVANGSTYISFNTPGSETFRMYQSGEFRMHKSTGANILWNTDGAGTIGAVGANRPSEAHILNTINLNSLTVSQPVVSDASKNLVSQSYAAFAANIDHGLLIGLADDDHLQYFKVIGRNNESLQITGAANLIWGTDGGGDIGASGANRPANIRARTSFFVGSNADTTAPKISTTGSNDRMLISSPGAYTRFDAGGSIIAYAYGNPGVERSFDLNTHLAFDTDNTHDLGTHEISNAIRRPRDIYLGRNLYFGPNTSTAIMPKINSRVGVSHQLELYSPIGSGSGDAQITLFAGSTATFVGYQTFSGTQAIAGFGTYAGFTTDNTFDFGRWSDNTTNARPRHAFIGTSIRNADGSVTVPSYSFQSDTDTGMYRVGSGEIGFAVDSDIAIRMSGSGTSTQLKIGSSGTPPYIGIGPAADRMLIVSPGAYTRFTSGGNVVGEMASGSLNMYRDILLDNSFTNPKIYWTADGNASSTIGNPTSGRPSAVHVKDEVSLNSNTSLKPISAQTTTTAYTAILTIPLTDTKAYKVKASVVARKTDGTKFAAYEIGILAYRQGGSATIVDTQTTYESHETDTTYDARWVVSGNNLIFEARGNDTSAETVDWKGHYVMETV